MQKKLFRILSVFLAVVIVSVCFMQPIAYANAAVVGGGLVLLVAGLLISCGMVFTSQAQAEAVANHTIAQMPSWLLDTLAGFVGGGDPSGKKPTYKMFVNGFTAAVSVSSAAFIAFKMWFDEHFGVDDEVWNDEGKASVPVATDSFVAVKDINGAVHNLPVYRVNQFNFTIADHQYYESLSIPWFDMNIDDKAYRIMPSTVAGDYRIYDINHSGYPAKSPASYCYASTSSNVRFVIFANNIDSKGNISATAPESYMFGFYNLDGFYDKMPYRWLYGSRNSWELCLSANQSGLSVDLSLEAHDCVLPEREWVTIGITDDMPGLIEKPYSEIINADNLDDWDYRGDLEAFRQLIESVCADLDKLKDYDGLLEQANALKDALDRANDAIAEDGADVIGGVAPLDDAMYDAGKVIDKVKEMIEEAEKDKDKPKDLDKIRDLEDEIDKAKEKIDDLTKSGDKDIPTDPTAPPISATKINWAPLAAIKGFSGVFPFCIPFDIINMVKSLQSAPEAPVFEIPFEIQGVFKEKIIVDLSVLNPIMPFVRLFILLVFAVSLARFTSAVIKW